MQSEGDLFARGAVATELIRVGLPENWGFLKKEFFAETGRKDGIPDLRQSILQALGKSPLTPPKREALLEVVLDERFAPLWTQPNRRMGDDMYRQYAIWAVIGSGIHIFVYILSDGTGLRIGTSDKKGVMYVDHVSKRLFPAKADKSHGNAPPPATDAEIDQWIKQLASADRSARRGAADCLGDAGPAADRAIPALIVALKEEARRPKADSEMAATTEEDYAGCLIRVLAGFGKTAVPPLIEVLKAVPDRRSAGRGGMPADRPPCRLCQPEKSQNWRTQCVLCVNQPVAVSHDHPKRPAG